MTDPLTVGILAGLIVNGLTALTGKAASLGLRAIQSDGDAIAASGAAAYRRRLEAVILAKADPSAVDAVWQYLQSTEAAAIFRQTYAMVVLYPYLTRVPITPNVIREAAAGLQAMANLSPVAAHHVAAELVTIFREVSVSLYPSTPSIPSQVRSALDDEVVGSGRYVAYLDGPYRTIDTTECDRVTRAIRQAIEVRHGNVTPPHVTVSVSVAIDKLYVPPSFHQVKPQANQLYGGRRTWGASTVAFSEFLARCRRTVVLGNPGSGKSTLAAKIATDLGRGTGAVSQRWPGAVPLLVVMRQYARERMDKGGTISDFVERQLGPMYQEHIPAGYVQYILESGRAVLICDGLDELPHEAARRMVKLDMEVFATAYPRIPVVVTSREVGYDQAPLDEQRFDCFQLAPFDQSQVASYSRKWFKMDRTLPAHERQLRSGQFIDDTALAVDLRQNPLILGLMCSMYRYERYIPRNRPDVYERCAQYLFEQWDAKRDIPVPVPYQSRLKPLINAIALEVYQSPHLQDGLTSTRLGWLASSFLLKRHLVENDAEATEAARRFVAFCTDRAWVFTDTGSTGDGEALYQFTHRTFLEYFAAGQLVRTAPTPRQLLGRLKERVLTGDWDVVSQLAVEIMDRQVDGGAEKFCTLLLGSAGGDARRLAASVGFVARLLAFVGASTRVADILGRAAVDVLTELAAEHDDASAAAADGVVQALGHLTSEAQQWFARAASRRILHNWRADARLRATSLDVGAALSSSVGLDWSRSLVPTVVELLTAGPLEDVALAQALAEAGEIPLVALVEQFGAGALLTTRSSKRVLKRDRTTIASAMLGVLMAGDRSLLDWDGSSMADILCEARTPWLEWDGPHAEVVLPESGRADVERDWRLAFCTMALLAALVELEGAAAVYRRLREWGMNWFAEVVDVRGRPKKPAQLPVGVVAVSERESNWLLAWSRQEVDLVRR